MLDNSMKLLIVNKYAISHIRDSCKKGGKQ